MLTRDIIVVASVFGLTSHVNKLDESVNLKNAVLLFYTITFSTQPSERIYTSMRMVQMVCKVRSANIEFRLRL